jgi:hypothetical protein
MIPKAQKKGVLDMARNDNKTDGNKPPQKPLKENYEDVRKSIVSNTLPPPARHPDDRRNGK